MYYDTSSQYTENNSAINMHMYILWFEFLPYFIFLFFSIPRIQYSYILQLWVVPVNLKYDTLLGNIIAG